MRGAVAFIILAVLFTGCSDPKKSQSGGAGAADPTYQRPPPKPEQVHWLAQKTEVLCAPGLSCPPQVGLLLFVFAETLGEKGQREFPLKRCTAFVTGASFITSNGHCDSTAHAQAFFITASNIPGGKRIRRVTGLASKLFTPHQRRKGDFDSGRPDVALFTLDSPIDIEPLAMASTSDPAYTRLTGFVVNGGVDLKYSVDRMDCDLRRHEASFPFELHENPDVLTVFNCQSRRGNSGAPMFAPGSAKVQAINQGFGDPQVLAQIVRQEHKRELFNYENRWTVKATNARCLAAPRGTCVAADDDETNRRFAEMQRRAHYQRNGRPLQFNEWAEVIN